MSSSKRSSSLCSLPRAWVVALVALGMCLSMGAAWAAPVSPVPPASAAPTRSVLSVAPGEVIAGESIRVTGRLATKGKRAVVVQIATGKKWKTVAKTSTTKAGAFRSALRATATSFKVRVVAPKKKAAKQVVTPVRRVTVQPQKVTLTTPSASVVPGSSVSFTAVATPARSGRVVVLEQDVAGLWTRVASTTQDTSGKASFTLQPAQPGTLSYRAVVAAAKGARAATSSVVTLLVTEAAPSAPQISTASLPRATVGIAYDVTLATVDGREGVWSATGLPAGVTVAMSGRITGVPTGPAGTSSVRVTFSDDNDLTATRTLALVVEAAATAVDWKSITNQGFTTCGIRIDNTGWCWGDNQHGSVGDGTTVNRPNPTRLPGAWKALTPSFGATCGIRTDGTGWCWGKNWNGGVGDGTTTHRSTPFQLPGTWTSLAPGSTTCGVRTDGTGWCWGENWGGQVGDGTKTARPTPFALPGTWKNLTPGRTTCGVRTDGTGWCWGENWGGQVGDGTKTDRATPTQLPGAWGTLTPGSTSCGVRTDSTGWCWGENWAGQVGDGATTDRSTPVQLPGVWSTLAPGSTTCGARTDGTRWCWGENWSGQVGDGGTDNRSTPAQLPGAWTSLTPGSTTCGVRSNATGWCWGGNEFGTVGDGTTEDRTSLFGLLGAWSSLGSNGFTTCGIRTDGTGWCWGKNEAGQVGDGTTTDRLVPVQLL